MDFKIEPTEADVQVFFANHPELMTELRLIALVRMHGALLDEHDNEQEPS